MDRSIAWEELNLRIASPGLLRHSLATEAVMRALAGMLEEDAALWGRAGLLHDIDVERVRDLPEQKGKMAGEILRNLDEDPTVIYAVEACSPGLGMARRRAIDKALYFAGAVAEQVIAAALEKPEKRLSSVTLEVLLQRHAQAETRNDPRSARVETCSALGLSVEQVYEKALQVLTAAGDKLGL